MTVPKFFLGNTIEEAEQTHAQFIKYINYIAKEYSLRTGIDKKDLVNESFLALRTAKINFDVTKGNFKTYAIVVIKNQLNEYVRTTNSTISLPKYVNHVLNLLNSLEHLLAANSYYEDIIDFILMNKIKEITLNEEDYIKYKLIIDKLINAAKRAKISLEKLLKRATYLPSIVIDNNLIENEFVDNQHDLQLEQLLNQLTSTEKEIAKKLVEGVSKKKIATQFGKSDTWVQNQILKMQKKLILTL